MRPDLPGCWTIQAEALLLPDGLRGPGFVTIEGDRIADVDLGRHPKPALTAAGQSMVPGFVDLQINGAAGCDFLFPTDGGMTAAHTHLVRTGTVAYLPTLITAPEDRVRRALAFFAGRMRRPDAPRILGVHLEGPFLSPARPGAHDVKYLRAPSVEWIRQLHEEFPGVIRLVTLAPELDGAGAVIDYLVDQGILVSAGHTDATFAQATTAFNRGVRFATHLFNAMRPYHHREPGAVGAALSHAGVACSIIADHVHVHPAVVDQIIACKSPDRTVLVTDAISAAGAAGASTLGDRAVRVENGAPRLKDGTLAGSILAMDQAVRHVARQWGMEQAVRMASTVPARLLGCGSGEIRTGMPADLVLLDGRLRVRTVVASGRLVRTPGFRAG